MAVTQNLLQPPCSKNYAPQISGYNPPTHQRNPHSNDKSPINSRGLVHWILSAICPSLARLTGVQCDRQLTDNLHISRRFIAMIYNLHELLNIALPKPMHCCIYTGLARIMIVNNKILF
jgi:hypothetical protein